MFSKINERFAYFVWKYLPSCKDITALISRSRDGDISMRERFILKLHLYTCFACRRYLKQLNFISEVCEIRNEKLEESGGAPGLSPEASDRLKKFIDSARALLLVIIFYIY